LFYFAHQGKEERENAEDFFKKEERIINNLSEKKQIAKYN
jgi:hypothetical protein